MLDLPQAAVPVGTQLKSRQQSVAVAESSAGGLISAALLAVPGASAYFLGGGTVYTSDAKKILLDIPQTTMDIARAATEAHALNLARAVQKRLNSTWGLGETGAAGPTGNRYGDAPGHTCIGVWGPVCRALTVETKETDRAQNMAHFAQAALDLLLACVEESGAK